MGIDGVRSTGPLPRTLATGATAAAAETAPATTTAASTTTSLSSDSSSIPASKLEAWSKNYQSATPENIQKIKDAFQNACGRQPTDYEIERALTRADIRGMDYIVDSINTSTEAAVRKYGSQVDSMIEEAANQLKAEGNLDENEYNKLMSSPDRKAFFADMLMQGQGLDKVKERLSNRLEKQDTAKLKDQDIVKKKDSDADKLKDTPETPNTGKDGKTPPVEGPKGTEKTSPTQGTEKPTPPEKTIRVGGRGMGGGSDTSFNVTPGELAAMYDILKNGDGMSGFGGSMISLEEMKTQLKELYGIDTEIKNGTLVTPDGRAIIADTNGNGILDLGDIDFGSAIQQVQQEFGIDITKMGRLGRLDALAKSNSMDSVLAIFERSRKAAEEAAKEAEKARQEGKSIDAATQAKMDAERAQITKDLSQAIEDNLGYDVAGEGATGKFVHEGEDIEKPLHEHEADTVNFEGDGDYENITDDVIKEEVVGDGFAGIEGEKHADPVKASDKAAKTEETKETKETAKPEEDLGAGLDAEEKAKFGIA